MRIWGVCMHELLCAGWGNQAGNNHVLMTQLLWFPIWFSLCWELKGWGETTVVLFVLSQGCAGTCSSLSPVLGSSWPHCVLQLVLLTFSTAPRLILSQNQAYASSGLGETTCSVCRAWLRPFLPPVCCPGITEEV